LFRNRVFIGISISVRGRDLLFSPKNSTIHQIFPSQRPGTRPLADTSIHIRYNHPSQASSPSEKGARRYAFMGQGKLNLQMERNTGYLFACASGERSRENVITMTINVFNTAIDMRLSKILLDVRELFGYFGFMDIFFLVKEVLVNLRGRGVDQVAVIDIHQTNRKDWFLEPVAHSSGLNIRVFTELDSAIKWLEDDGSQPLV
jgi:hypothetical protein